MGFRGSRVQIPPSRWRKSRPAHHFDARAVSFLGVLVGRDESPETDVGERVAHVACPKSAFADDYVVVAVLRLASVGVTVSSATYGVCRWTGSDFRRTRRLIVSTKSEN